MRTAVTLAPLAVPAIAAGAQLPSAEVPGGTDLVERRDRFDEKGFAAAVGRTADIRQVWENVALRPNVLTNIKNALNSLQYGFGYDAGRIAIAAVNHGPSTSYTYADEIWKKYRIGDYFDFKDAAGNRIATNVFFPERNTDPSTDPASEAGVLQDTGIAALQKRGVTFITCHTAVEEQARGLIKGGFAPAGMSPADVSADILTHLIPGAIVVPGGVGALAVLQQKYGYSYATVQ